MCLPFTGMNKLSLRLSHGRKGWSEAQGGDGRDGRRHAFKNTASVWAMVGRCWLGSSLSSCCLPWQPVSSWSYSDWEVCTKEWGLFLLFWTAPSSALQSSAGQQLRTFRQGRLGGLCHVCLWSLSGHRLEEKAAHAPLLGA